MSLIVCTDPCVYQQDGYCSLARAASCGSTGGSGCVNFVPRLQNGGQCFPDVGHPDHVQALRNRQLSLDPFRDQALGKSQAPHLTEPLSQGTHRPQLAGQADLSDGGQVAGNRPVPEAGGKSDHSGQISGGLLQ